MRTNLLKSFATVMVAVSFVSAQAQITTTSASRVNPVGNEATDYVTVGSIMPYEVIPDASITALQTLGTVDQIFRWTIAPAGPTITRQDGSAVTAAGAPDAATHIQDYQVAYSFSAINLYTISVAEKSQFVGDDSYSCVDASPSTLNVQVVAEPSVIWNDADLRLGGCGVAGTSIDIPVTLAGTDLFRCTYTVNYVDLTGTATPTTTTTGDLGASDIFTDFTNTESIPMFSLAIPAATYGRYEITISSVTDRISRKSLNDYVTETATYGSQDPGSFPATTLIVYSLPTPSTGAIQHVTNLGW